MEVVYRKEFQCARCKRPFLLQKYYQLYCSDFCEDVANALMKLGESPKSNKKSKQKQEYLNAQIVK